MIVCFSCDKQNDTGSDSPRAFNPNIDGIAIQPVDRIDAERAAQIRNDKQAILAGENTVPAIPEDYTPAATTVARPTPSPTPSPSRPAVPSPPSVTSTTSTSSTSSASSTYSFDPNAY